MTLRRMLERAAAARETFENRLDRLNGSGPAVPTMSETSAEGTLAAILAADCARVLGDLAGLEAPPASQAVVDAQALPPSSGSVAGAGTSP